MRGYLDSSTVALYQDHFRDLESMVRTALEKIKSMKGFPAEELARDTPPKCKPKPKTKRITKPAVRTRSRPPSSEELAREAADAKPNPETLPSLAEPPRAAHFGRNDPRVPPTHSSGEAENETPFEESASSQEAGSDSDDLLEKGPPDEKEAVKSMILSTCNYIGWTYFYVTKGGDESG